MLYSFEKMEARSVSELGEDLYHASVHNKIIKICRLLTAGADVNYLRRWMDQGRLLSATPLIQASSRGHVDAVRVLISRGADVNKQEPCNGWAALHAAAHFGHVPVIGLLVSKGTSLDLRNNIGRATLHAAVFKGHVEAVTCLLDYGADINAKCSNEGSTPLRLAAQEGHLHIVDLLVLRGADVNLANVQQVTPLFTASEQGHLDVIKFLSS